MSSPTTSALLATIVVATAILGGLAAGQPAATSPLEPAAVVALTPDRLAWETMPGFADGRQRVLLVGRPEAGGQWIYRVRVPTSIRVEAHTHPVDEYVTVLEGSWSLGVGRRFEPSALVAYPPGSFVRIPAGTPHFVATGEGTAVIQASGSGVFATVPIR